MSSRDKILASVLQNQRALTPLPADPVFPVADDDLREKFMGLAVQIGSRVFEPANMEEISQIINRDFSTGSRVISTLPETEHFVPLGELQSGSPHAFEDVDFLLLNAHFGVAENSALWITEELLPQRALPFITQHLGVVLNKKDLVATMHQGYERIADSEYDYGTFIAGPSKTADIEQSLVLGAHGPRSLTIFLI